MIFSSPAPQFEQRYMPMSETRLGGRTQQMLARLALTSCDVPIDPKPYRLDVPAAPDWQP